MKQVSIAILAIATVIATPVLGADLAYKAPYKAPVASEVPYSWTGLYVGAQAGYGWATQSLVTTAASGDFPVGYALTPVDMSGGLVGGQIGANYQINRWVLGIEGSYSYADISGSSTDASVFVAGKHNTQTDRLHYLATATGRVGYAWDQWLVYGKGGGAWTRNTANIVDVLASGAVSGTSTGAEDRDGWIVGGGVEYALWKNWSARLEYNYLNFGTVNVQRVSNTGFIGTRTDKLQMDTVTAALNYRFDLAR